jgi:acyl-CoA thioesterase I
MVEKYAAIIMIGCFLIGIPVCQVYAKTFRITGESLVLAKTEPGRLCFDRVEEGMVVVRSTYKANDEKCLVYKEGLDYTVDYVQGTISRTANSSIPDYSKHQTYGIKDFDHAKLSNVSNHPFFIWVDYTTDNGKPFAKRNNQTKFLTAARAKLEKGGPFKIVTYGDSITAGGEASEPDLRFQSMYAKFLQNKFPKAKIEVQDVSIPGYRSVEGVAWFDKYVGKTTPDLVLVGFGMNDQNIGSTTPEQFQENLVKLAKMIKEQKGADVILFSSFPPNDDWHYGSHRMKLYAQITKKAAKEAGCAYVDVFSVWEMVLKRKDQSSLLGNNINHPNDFGHWLYEQAFEAMKF